MNYYNALLLVNRHSRNGQRYAVSIAAQLELLGLKLIEEPIKHPEALSDLIRQYRDRVDLVVIGGGDGTLNAAAAGLVDTQIPLAILPLGTANDLARTLGIAASPIDACKAIATSQVRRIDLGWVNGKYFFNVASLGLSVKITNHLTKEAKSRWGVLAYAKAALQAIWQSRPFSAIISQSGESVKVKTLQIAVGNGRFYGGGMAVAADAAIDDHRLDLYSLEVMHWWQIAFLLPSLWRGEHGRASNVRSLHCREVTISTRKPRPINTDGELTTYTPAQFRVIPQAIPVIVPG
ncbi:lipid kinase [Pseudanabaena sp. PCC 6802]|uniref:lipid kinase n=1 Tax=Pseudanabaena sp. PCC 6802 TaxID=118173 RepID=UPI00034A0D7B|nr:lipid kinase [Pseudanabaena sp. PCC 6802]